jgi:membrane fusion protein, multidrug efflux system
MKIPKMNSINLAIGLTIIIILWLLSGIFSSDDGQEKAKSVVDSQVHSLIKVQVRSDNTQDHAHVIRLYGQTQADRDVDIKSETSGRIEEVLIEKGALVKAGDIIARIAMDDRDQRLKSAKALVRQRQLEFDASRELSQKSFRSQTKLAESEALMYAAKADLDSIRLDVSHTEITAPFDGKLEDKKIEVGDYVTSGTLLARIVDLSPINVSAAVSENDIAQIHDGQPAFALLSDGRKIEGIVRFVAQTSSNMTRTFKIEIEGENPDNAIVAGLTAEVHLQIGTQQALRLSPAVLTLSDEGVIGVKTVDETDTVQFNPITLLEDTPDGIWVSGLPQKTRLITRGQEYVHAGQKVIPVEGDK